MSVEKEIYDFEGAIESAVENVLNAAALKTFSAQDAPQFQKDRARVEVMLVAGASIGGLWPEANQEATPGSLRETTFSGTLHLTVITEANIQSHAAYRARVRNKMATIKRDVNGSLLTRHKINSCKSSGVTAIYKPQDGLFETKIQFEIQFSIQNDAWADLAAET